jgi:hypothetical protein
LRHSDAGALRLSRSARGIAARKIESPGSKPLAAITGLRCHPYSATAAFWNIWRGTPAVFRYQGTTQWLVKRELAKEESGATEEHAAYILEQTIDIALRQEEHWRRIRSLRHGGTFVVRLKQDGVASRDRGF